MASPSSFVPDLGAQPPSVDFIENRMPKYSPAFRNSPVYYNTASQRFVSIERQKSVSLEQTSSVSIQNNAIEQEFRPIGQSMALVTSPCTNTEAMKYWDEIFSDALTQLQTTSEPRIKNSELRIRCDKGWDTIYLKLEKARSEYLKQGGQFGQIVRWCADHTTSATVLVKIAQGVAPSNPYSTPILGAVQLILNAMQVSADARTQALNAFKDLWKVFSEAELFLSTFPTSQLVRISAIELTVAVLSAIENAIAFFSTSRPRRMLQSVVEGSEYVKGLERSFKSIEDKSNSLRNQGQNTFLQGTYTYTVTLYNAFLGFMNEHVQNREDASRSAMESEIRHKAEMAQMNKKYLRLQVENEELRSRSPSPSNFSLAQQQVGTKRTYLNEQELRYLLNIDDKDVDMSFIAKRKSHLLNGELSHAEQLINDDKFRTWMTSAESAKLLILWNQRRPKSNAGISPLSAFCASLGPMLYDHDRFICGIWFCALHAKSGNDDTGAMLASLIGQICQQYMFDFDSLEIDGVNKALVETRDPVELYNLLYALIKALPADVTLMLLIDEIYIYEREQFEDGPSIFNELVNLVEDKSLSTAVKLLFTSTGRVGYVRKAFQHGDQVLNVETAAYQRGGPSEKRMTRQMMQNFEG